MIGLISRNSLGMDLGAKPEKNRCKNLGQMKFFNNTTLVALLVIRDS